LESLHGESVGSSRRFSYGTHLVSAVYRSFNGWNRLLEFVCCWGSGLVDAGCD
jgi:hypothetical protein